MPGRYQTSHRTAVASLVTPMALSSSGSMERQRSNQSTNPWSPQQYAQMILLHSKQGAEATLYPGRNFQPLAAYLQRPFEKQSSRKPSPARDDTKSLNFATWYTINAEGKMDFQQPKDPDHMVSISAASANTEADTRRLLFLRGQPYSEWLSRIGAAYCIDPEFFQRHLDFLSTMGRRNCFAQPSLLSASKNIIQLSYYTIGQLEGYSEDVSQREIEAFRQASDKEMVSYMNNLSKQIAGDSSPSDSMVRGYSILDQNHFVIEQRISMCVGQMESGWTAVAWIDTGTALKRDQAGPWGKHPRAHGNISPVFLPTIQIQPFVALKPRRYSVTSDHGPAEKSGQSASLLHLGYGKKLDGALMACDPFYAMQDIFLFCAFSEAQFLNLVESKLDADARPELSLDQPFSPSNLIYSQELLDSHADRLRETINAISARESLSWPRPSDARMQQKGATAALSLLKDYEDLLARAIILSDRCKTRMNILMNKAMIAESNKAITQAREVTKLTRLAFVFIPLSFTATFFGMNLGPLVERSAYGVWLWASVSAPVLIVSLAIMKWDLSKIWARLKNK